MGCAKYVGRVGALAVALGIGSAAITAPGIAVADDGTAGSETTDNSTAGGDDTPGGGIGGGGTESHVGSNPTTDSGSEAVNTGSGTSGTTTISVGGGPEVMINAQTTITSTTDDNTTGAPAPSSSAPTSAAPTSVAPTTPAPTSVDPVPGDPTSVAPTSSAPVFPFGGAVLNTDPAANPNLIQAAGQGSSTPLVADTLLDNGTTLVGGPEVTRFARTFNALAATNDNAALGNPTTPYPLPNPPTVSTPPTDPIAALIALPGNVLSFAVDLISAALTPFFTGTPSAPADTPVLWAVLAFVRRQFFNTSPTLAPSGQVADLTTGQLYGRIGATDPDGDPLTYDVLQGPAHGAVMVNASGEYVYTPTTGYVGADSFTVAVTDGGAHVHGLNGLLSPYGAHATVATIGLTAVGVTPAGNTAPRITATPGATDPSTGVIRYTVTTADTPGDTVKVTVATPLHGTIAPDATTAGVYVYTPDPAYAHSLALGGNATPGGDTITFTATDLAGAFTAVTVTPVVAPVNTAPTLTLLAEPTTNANGAIKVTITYADADTDVLTATIGPLAHGGLYASPTGGTPLPAGTSTSPGPVGAAGTTEIAYYIPNPSQPGTDALSITLSDAYGGTVTKTQTFVVDAPANHAPTVTLTTTPSGLNDGSVYVTVTFGEQDADIITATLSTPVHGTYSLDGQPISGFTSPPTKFGPDEQSVTFLYTPDPTKPGTETISFTVTDAAGATATAFADVVVTDSGVNQNPTAEITAGEPAADGTVLVSVTFSDPEGDDVTVFYPEPETGTLTYLEGQDTYDDDAGTVTQYYEYKPYDPSRVDAYATLGDDVETLTFDISDTDDEFGDNTVVDVDVTISPLPPAVGNHAPTVTVTSESTGLADGSVFVTITYGEQDDDTVIGTLSTPVHGTYSVNGLNIPGFTSSPTEFGPEEFSVTLLYTPDPTKPGTETISFTLTDAAGATATDSVDVVVAGNNEFVITTPINALPNQTDGGVTGSFAVTSPDGAAIGAFVADEDKPTYGTVEVTVTPTGVAGVYTVSYVYTPDPLARLAAYSGGPAEDSFAVTISGAPSVAQVASFARTTAAVLPNGNAPTTVPVIVPVLAAGSVVVGEWANAIATVNAVAAPNGTVYQPYLMTTNGKNFVAILGRDQPVAISGVAINAIWVGGDSNAYIQSLAIDAGGAQRSVISVVTPDGRVTEFDAPRSAARQDILVSGGIVYLHGTDQQNKDHLYRVTPTGISADLVPASSSSAFAVGDSVYSTQNVGANSVALYRDGAQVGSFLEDSSHLVGLYGSGDGYLYVGTRVNEFVLHDDGPTTSKITQTVYRYTSSGEVALIDVGNDDIPLTTPDFAVAPDGTLYLGYFTVNGSVVTKYVTHLDPGATSFSSPIAFGQADSTALAVYGPSVAYSLGGNAAGAGESTLRVTNLYNGAVGAPITGFATGPISVGSDGNAYLTVGTSQGALEIWRVGPNGATTRLSSRSPLLAPAGPPAVGSNGVVYVSNNLVAGLPVGPNSTFTAQLIGFAPPN